MKRDLLFVVALLFFFTAAASDAASSGNDVPQAMRVSEMIASLTPNDLATATALSTKKSQLVMRIASPPNNFIMASHIGVLSSVVAQMSSADAFFLSR